MMDTEQTLTTGEVAKYCGVSFRTVIRWIEDGLLKAYQLPKRGDNRIRLIDLLDFMRRNQIPLVGALRTYSHRVLIVEDEPSMAKAIQRVLRGAGYETHIAGDGFAAGVAMLSFSPAMMTLDLQMPAMNGFAVLDSLRTGLLPPVKVLVISALPDDMIRKALDSGAHDAMSKPFDNEILLAKAAALIGQPRPGDPA